MAQESLKNKTVKGVGWSAIDTIANYGISFLVGLILARLLTPEDYGLIGIITAFVMVSNNIVDGGFFNALVRKPDANDSDFSTIFYLNLVISLLLTVILFLGAPLIASFFQLRELEPLTKALSVVVVINAFSIVPKSILTIQIDFKTQTKVSLISSTTSGVVGIGMALMGFGVWALVGQQISRQLLNTFFLWIYNRWIPQLRFSSKSFRELFGFGWKIMISNLLDSIWKEINQIVIGKCYSATVLGQYTRATQFSSIFSTVLTTVIQRVSYPVLSTIQDETERMVVAYRRVIKMSMLITFIPMIGLVAVAKPMVLVLVGEQWLPCVPYLQLLCFSLMLYPLHSINLNMLQILGRSDIYLYLEIIKKILALGPIILGIFVSVYWLLIGNIIVGFISYFLNTAYSGKMLNYSSWAQLKDIRKSFVISISMAFPIWTLSFLPLTPFLILPIQVLLGGAVVYYMCEKMKLDEYLELKQICVTCYHKACKR